MAAYLFVLFMLAHHTQFHLYVDSNWLADYPLRDVSVLYSVNFHESIECLQLHLLLLLIVTLPCVMPLLSEHIERS